MPPRAHLHEYLMHDIAHAAADGIVEGYASLFGAVDHARDVVMPGAFAASLAQRGAKNIRMLFQHDPAVPLGVWLELREDAKGLFARGRLLPEVARAREIFALVRAGAADGLSIGFRTVRGRPDPRAGLRRLDAVDLWEISIVTFPLLPGARVRAAKASPRPSSLPGVPPARTRSLSTGAATSPRVRGEVGLHQRQLMQSG